ncbi:tyrosine-type recombinase/integrase [Modestobacter altitudinis]|uniref:tyrosine-type recombinase/integrase n=1 Tax=Modestobacter altitudinis TaxID=2213158 RepID=UPI00110CC124|nr:tyrosine-type recombinase/integrase [Modestobacter altitudinis]
MRPIKETTHKEYLATLRNLDLADVPFDSVTVAMLNTRLQRVLSPNTRRKHAINLRACLGLPIPCPRAQRTEYDLPPLEQLRGAVEGSSYRLWGYAMLLAGLRLGEVCTNQPIKGNVITVDRQRLPDGTISTPKTGGPVIVPEWYAEEYRNHDFTKAANTVYIGIRRAGKKAGLGNSLTPKVLRHAFATNLVNAGCSPEVLRRQMRHHDVSVSLRFYVQTTQADVEEAIIRAFG